MTLYCGGYGVFPTIFSVGVAGVRWWSAVICSTDSFPTSLDSSDASSSKTSFTVVPSSQVG